MGFEADSFLSKTMGLQLTMISICGAGNHIMPRYIIWLTVMDKDVVAYHEQRYCRLFWIKGSEIYSRVHLEYLH